MNTINDTLAAILATVRTPGDFYATGTRALHFPRIEVDGFGPIALPMLPEQSERLIDVAERAPFGRGPQTLVDTTVRRTWQLGADRVRIVGKQWDAMLDDVVAAAAAGLGAGSGVTAELYKLLIYDEGSHFVSHRDTEKSSGMFATLIVGLPSLFDGGELVVRHRGREVHLDLRVADFAEIAWGAFYADCVHEVLPVTSGLRLALVYNLLRKGKRSAPRPPAYDRETAELKELFGRWSTPASATRDDPPVKLIYPLEHAYTPAELSFAALKGADAAVAGLLASVSREVACDVYAALVRIEESGTAEYSGFPRSRGSWRYHDDDEEEADEDEFTVVEIDERTQTLSHWCNPEGNPVALGTMPFEDDEICPADALDDMAPDEQHFHEATGNEGASFERSYQRAALVLWPRANTNDVLARAGLDVSLPALGRRVSAWVDDHTTAGSPSWHEAHALATRMIADWRTQNEFGFEREDSAEAAMLSHLARLQDARNIDAMLAGTIATGRCSKQVNAAVVDGLTLLEPARVGHLLLAIVQGNARARIGSCADLLARVAEVSAWHPRMARAAEALVEEFPDDGARTRSQGRDWDHEDVDAALVLDILRALAPANLPALTALADRAVTHWLAAPRTYGMDKIIVPAIRLLSEQPALMQHRATQQLCAAAREHLQARVALALEPPADWRRESAIGCRCEHCNALQQFLASRNDEVWRFRAREADRRHVEDAIRRARCDIDCTTERTGRPHALVCRKNQASYERRVEQRRKDLADLQRPGMR